MSLRDLTRGERVLVSLDGRIESATFVKLSGCGAPVVCLASGAQIALYSTDSIGRCSQSA
jgi:hypothetical protein